MLKTLQKQVIDKHDFLVFLRDLASNLNINLKHIIEDSVKGEIIKEDKKRKKDYHKGKKKVITTGNSKAKVNMKSKSGKGGRGLYF